MSFRPKRVTMKSIIGPIGIVGLSVTVLLAWGARVGAQTFSSGSTGADGAFAPTANTTVTLPPSGVFNYTTVTIPAGVIVTLARNAANTPATILAKIGRASCRERG